MNNLNKYKVILASQSPRRREIMAMAGFSFEVMPAEGEEKSDALRPDELTMMLSKAKAEEIYEKENGKMAEAGSDRPLLVIGADTVVAYNGEILGKPKDLADAYRMLRLLSGHVHQVYTGVTLILANSDGTGGEPGVCRRTFYEKTDVSFHELTDEEILQYIHTEEPLDKAGSYAIQGAFGKYIQKIDGDYYNVVGLPIQRIWQELKVLA